MNKNSLLSSVFSLTSMLVLLSTSLHAEQQTALADQILPDGPTCSKSQEDCTKLADQIGTLPDGFPTITKTDIQNAQKMWGDAVVSIGKAKDQNVKEVAKKAIEAAYAFEIGPILFKPTLASAQPFRSDLEGTLSYFIDSDPKYAEDKGFALKPWTKVRFDNYSVKLFGNKAIAMGHYYFTDTDGKETKVEYTKGYVKTAEGQVLIFLQHSSLPYSAN